jgi:putative transposase
VKEYKKASHTVWDCKYHLVWITKYRYPVLVGQEPGTVGHRARELLRDIARSLELSIYAGAINREHVHMLLSIPPYLSVSRAVQFLKGKSSHKLLSEFPSLRKRYWGPASLGTRLLGRVQRQCHRRGVAKVHRGAKARDS